MARNQIGNAGVAFPEIFMCALETFADRGEQNGPGRLRHIPDFVGLVAKHPKHVELAFFSLGQIGAATNAHHLGTALFRLTLLTGDMG